MALRAHVNDTQREDVLAKHLWIWTEGVAGTVLHSGGGDYLIPTSCPHPPAQ